MPSEFSPGDPKTLRYLHTQVLVCENRVLVAEIFQWPIGILAAIAIYGGFGVVIALFCGGILVYLAALPERRKLKIAEEKLASYKAQFPELEDDSYL